MSVQVASRQTATTGSGTTITVDKPSGLAVGDLMIAGASVSTGGSDTKSFNTPSGWTELEQQGQDTNNSLAAVWAKIADSSDVAASNFTFTANDGGSNNDNMIGFICRVTSTNGFNTVASKVASSSGLEAGGGATSPSFSGLTTSYDDTLLLMILSAERADGDVGFSGYAVATNDPTWTELEDINNEPSGISNNLAIASATYATAGSTGNFSAVAAGASATSGFLIAITENQNATVTPTTLVLAPDFNTPTATAGVNVSPTTLALAPTFNTPTPSGRTPVWTTTQKS